jgi:hypothetical protein
MSSILRMTSASSQEIWCLRPALWVLVSANYATAATWHSDEMRMSACAEAMRMSPVNSRAVAKRSPPADDSGAVHSSGCCCFCFGKRRH